MNLRCHARNGVYRCTLLAAHIGKHRQAGTRGYTEWVDESSGIEYRLHHLREGAK